MALVAAAPLLPHVAPLLPPCLLKALTGVPCPACGTTRAALSLGSGHPLEALRWNPLGCLALVALVLGGLIAGARALTGRGLKEPRSYPLWARLIVIGMIGANWIWLFVDGR